MRKQSPIGPSETINTPVPQQIHYPVQSVYTLRFGSTSMYMEWLVLRWTVFRWTLSKTAYSSLFWASALWHLKTSKTPKKKRKRLFWRKMNSFVLTCCGQSLMIFEPLWQRFLAAQTICLQIIKRWMMHCGSRPLPIFMTIPCGWSISLKTCWQSHELRADRSI